MRIRTRIISGMKMSLAVIKKIVSSNQQPFAGATGVTTYCPLCKDLGLLLRHFMMTRKLRNALRDRSQNELQNILRHYFRTVL